MIVKTLGTFGGAGKGQCVKLAFCIWSAITGTVVARGDGNISPGWGIDACLTAHVPDPQFFSYIHLLRNSGVKVLRERGVGPQTDDGSYSGEVRRKFRTLRREGFSIVAFASGPEKAAVAAGNGLPDDLLAVYKHGEVLGREIAGVVDALEMVGEPDVGYCRDLPDHLVAYQKALYLGIKAGGVKRAGAPLVLMGALALPPGPWLERAARNGLLDYTDAYNFHFYGNAGDFVGVMGAHRAFIRAWAETKETSPSLPLWTTECGVNCVDLHDFLNPGRRTMQAKFTTDTASEALAQPDMAVFMPFILVHPEDPSALTLRANRPFQAWNDYASLTRDHPWPQRFWARVGNRPNQVVEEWVPDRRTTIPFKVSGTYRFRDNIPIRGEIRIYNFGDRPVHGNFRMSPILKVSSSFPAEAELTIGPEAFVALHGSFLVGDSGYFQTWVSANFDSDDGKQSPLWFGLETPPQANEFECAAPRFLPIGKLGTVRFPEYSDYQVSSVAGPWLGLNGVIVDQTTRFGARFRITKPTAHSASDPLYPPMAAVRLDGLPAAGFLRVSPERIMSQDFAVRVDLIDEAGQRFTIWENFGQSYFQPGREIWLNFRDFHIYFWGHCLPKPKFDPTKIREMQLRFYCGHPDVAMVVNFALMQAR